MNEITVAKNSIEFATSPKFLNIAELWPMQIKILGSLFEDVCMNRSCTDLEFWNGIFVDTQVEEIWDRVTFFDRGKCPRCGLTRKDFPQWYNFKNEFVLIAGIRSGKTFLVSEVIAPYLLHRALTRGQENFGLLEDTTLAGVFSAPTSQQAIASSWHMFSYRLKESPWFQEFHQTLGEIEARNDGITCLQSTPSSLRYPQHGITLYCLSYQDLRQIRGRTSLFAIVSANDTTPELSPTEESLRSLRMTLRTIRANQERSVRSGNYHAQQGMLLYESTGFSPASREMYNRATSKSAENRSLGLRLATWEITPQFSQESLRNQCLQLGGGRPMFERDFAVSVIGECK